AETEALVAGMLELPLDERRRVGAWVHRESGGIPGVAVERVRALADEDRLRREADGRWERESPPAAMEPAPPLPRAVPPGGVFVAREREMEKLEAALSRAM